MTSDYGFSVQVAEGYDEAVTRTRLALRGEGFSIITEADVGGVLDPKVAERQYLFMGAWDAPASRRDVDRGLQVATHLPCNVVVQETVSGALVAALDPREDANADDPAHLETAEVATNALRRVLERVTHSL